MKILALAKVGPQTTPEKIQPHLAAEVEHAWRLYKTGTVRELYRCEDRPLGVVFMLELDGVEEARRALAELPFVREQLIEFELIPLGPFAYFDMLFANHGAAPPG